LLAGEITTGKEQPAVLQYALLAAEQKRLSSIHAQDIVSREDWHPAARPDATCFS